MDLLTGDRRTSTGALRPVRLQGAHITGTLDLETRKLLCPVLLQDCYFGEAINLREAEAISIYLSGCQVPEFNANQLRTTGNVYLDAGFVARGEINLVGARIGGVLSLNGASLTNAGGTALNADQLTVDQHMSCGDGFTARGETRLIGAHVGGQLSFAGATLANANGTALYADQLTVGRSMFCDEGFTVHGETRLLGACIGGQLNLNGASLTNANGHALNADNLAVSYSVLCDGGFTAHGEIQLVGSRIGGILNLNGASLTNANGYALNADNLTVDQDMFCSDGFTATGIGLLGAHVGGQLIFSGASLANANGTALQGGSLTVGQTMFCEQDFTADGEIGLIGAHVGGGLVFAGASLTNANGIALNADNLTVDQDMFCNDGFTAHGGVLLTNAKVGMFHDDLASWPDKLWIRGFAYAGFGEQTVGTRARLQWLRRHDGPFTPQIYDQLAEVYRRAGDDGAARKVAVAKQWRRRKPYNPLSWLWWVTVGYGYRTWQAFIWAAALTVIGALVFSGAYPAHMVTLTAHPPEFQPVIYALDVLLPIGGLGQKSAWQPTGVYLHWYWGLAIAGWVLSAAVVAGLTGILKRD